MNRSRLFLIAGVLLVLVAAAFAGALFFAYQGSRIAPSPTVADKTPQQAKYVKGKASFFYPTGWQANDLPTQEGFITVQVTDPDEFIVFVASSAPSFTDSDVSGDLVREGDRTIDSVAGRERVWQDTKGGAVGAVVFRADNFEFEGRSYRFEMLTNATYKTKAERIWGQILGSVRFAQAETETIEANPQ